MSYREGNYPEAYAQKTAVQLGIPTPPLNPASSEHSMVGQLARLREMLEGSHALASQLEGVADRLVGPTPTSQSGGGGEVKRLGLSGFAGGFAGGIAECNELLGEFLSRVHIAMSRISSHIG